MAAFAGLSFIVARFRRFNITTSIGVALDGLRGPIAFCIGVAVQFALIPVTGFDSGTQLVLAHVSLALFLAGVGWAVWRAIGFLFDVLRRRAGEFAAEDPTLRSRQTRLNLMRQLSLGIVAVATVAAIAVSVPALRTLGVSLFASAGAAGIVLGLAARPAISNLLAGIQIAFAEPIRIGDVVVVEGEWGHIEDITATYVVIVVWDQRRLVIPLSYFLEKPIQNWTRRSPQLLGTAFLYLDYTVPVEEVRQELHRILDASPLWDRRVWAVQVTDLRERVMEIRCLMSAGNGGDLFGLRCEVREKMIAFLTSNYPDSLPQVRFETELPERNARVRRQAAAE